MSKHIDETKRRFCKVAGLAGAALMLDLPGSLRQAAATEVPGKGAEKRASGERPITFRDAVERLKRSGDMVSVKRAGVNDHKTRACFTHQIAVGTGAGHQAGVGCRQAQHVAQQRHRSVGLPVAR